jgi:hypothetical protein
MTPAAYSPSDLNRRYALRTLESIQEAETSTARLTNVLRKLVFLPASSAPTRAALVETFAAASGHMQDQLLQLIIQADVCEATLEHLEAQLDVVFEIAERGNKDVEVNKQKLVR